MPIGGLGGLNLGNLPGGGEIADTVGKAPSAADQDSFKKDTRAGFWTWPEEQLASGEEQVLTRFTVPAGTEYAWGYGRAKDPENQGYQYVDIQNSTPAAIDGSLFYTQETATGRFERYVAEFDTNRLAGSQTDRTNMVPFPEAVDFPTVKKDMDMVVRMDPASTDTPSQSDSTVIWPVTEYDLTEGDIGRNV